MKFTQSDLKELIEYDAQTGVVTWKRRDRHWFKSDLSMRKWNTRNSGMVAGSLKPGGYIYISILKTHILAHRAIWLLVYGVLPDLQVDHINGNKDDNRLCNLRMVTAEENRRNMRLMATNKTGFSCVTYSAKYSKYIATISDKNKPIHLGTFEKKEDAIRARKDAEEKYGYHENHGRFVRNG